MCKAVIHYRERKLLSDIDVSREGRESVEDGKHSGRPQASRTADNIRNGFYGGTKEQASNNRRISSAYPRPYVNEY
ncbi:hypothetical protein TNCV_4307511 [Trichonephila clavipes]|nr:hypothetical protein TNCV_4307511 [Trichonephila clavipes]